MQQTQRRRSAVAQQAVSKLRSSTDHPRQQQASTSGISVAQLHHRYWLVPYVVGAVVGVYLACAWSTEPAGLAPMTGRRSLQQLAGGPSGGVPPMPYEYEDEPNPPPLRYTGLPPEEMGQVLRTLSFSHLWQDDRYEKYVFGDPKIMNQMMIFISGTIMTYLIVVNILSCFVLPFIAPQFRDLDIFGQMAVTTNCLYTILLLAQLVPYTVIIIGILFGDCRSKQFPAFYYTVFVFLTTHAIMYAYEGIVRSVIKVNYLLLIHHAMFFVFMILEFVNQSNFVVKTCLILDYFVVWEAGLYLTNVCYRLKANYTVLKWIMIIGTTVHGVTHLLQAMLLTAFFVGMGKRMQAYHISKGIFAFMVITCALLVCYQYYLEKIFYEMWLKVAKAHRAKSAAATADVEHGGSGDPSVSGEDQALLKRQALSSDAAVKTPVSISRQGSDMAEAPGIAASLNVMRQSSLELKVAIIAGESHMLGELPTFPAKMTSLHLPRASSLNRSPRTSGTGTGDAGLQLTPLTPPSAFTASPSPQPAAHTSPGPAAVSRDTKKKRDNILTDDMWAQTED